MCTVAKHKHIRTHPSHCEVWDGFFCICLPLLVSAGPQVQQKTHFSATTFSHQGLLFLFVFSLTYSFIYSSIYYDSVMCLCFCLLLSSCTVDYIVNAICQKCCYSIIAEKMYNSNFVDVHLIKMLFHHDWVMFKCVFPQPKKNCFIHTQSKEGKTERKK